MRTSAGLVKAYRACGGIGPDSRGFGSEPFRDVFFFSECVNQANCLFARSPRAPCVEALRSHCGRFPSVYFKSVSIDVQPAQSHLLRFTAFLCTPSKTRSGACVCESISKQSVCLSESCLAVQNLHKEPHGECRILRAGKERLLGIIVACL